MMMPSIFGENLFDDFMVLILFLRCFLRIFDEASSMK